MDSSIVCNRISNKTGHFRTALVVLIAILYFTAYGHCVPLIASGDVQERNFNDALDAPSETDYSTTSPSLFTENLLDTENLPSPFRSLPQYNSHYPASNVPSSSAFWRAVTENSDADHIVVQAPTKRFVFSSFGWGAGGVPLAYSSSGSSSASGSNSGALANIKGKRFVFSSFGWGAAGVPRSQDFHTQTYDEAALKRNVGTTDENVDHIEEKAGNIPMTVFKWLETPATSASASTEEHPTQAENVTAGDNALPRQSRLNKLNYTITTLPHRRVSSLRSLMRSISAQHPNRRVVKQTFMLPYPLETRQPLAA